jgi:hypothetical protein
VTRAFSRLEILTLAPSQLSRILRWKSPLAPSSVAAMGPQAMQMAACDGASWSLLLAILNSLREGVSVFDVRADGDERQLLFENEQAKRFREAGRMAPCIKTLEKTIEWVESDEESGASASMGTESPAGAVKRTALLEVTGNPIKSPLVTQVLEAIPEVTWMAEPETAALVFLSKSGIARISGGPVEEFIDTGLPLEERAFKWQSQLHPEDRQRTGEEWINAMKNKTSFDNG